MKTERGKERKREREKEKEREREITKIIKTKKRRDGVVRARSGLSACPKAPTKTLT